MNIDLVLKRLELIKESKGINTISDTEASIILNEIERLNNIINELEKWLKEKQILYGINHQGFSWGVCGEALDKLQELKGEDKGE